MTQLSESVVNVIEQLSSLPGIGKKSAERLAYHILRIPKSDALALADAIRDVRTKVRYCEICFNLSEDEQCKICLDPKRDQRLICVVEQPRDLMALEQSGQYNGLYHVLLGKIAPLEGVGPESLTIDPLIDRIKSGSFEELIMATNPTVEGDGTALYISNQLQGQEIKISKLARGITQGSILEYTNKEILADAMSGRRPL